MNRLSHNPFSIQSDRHLGRSSGMSGGAHARLVLLVAWFAIVESACPVGFYAHFPANSDAPACKICKGCVPSFKVYLLVGALLSCPFDRFPRARYEAITGERDGVSHAARGARPYADVLKSPWSKGGGGWQVRRISHESQEAPVCPKGHWLQDGCAADAESGGQSSATVDNVCWPCVGVAAPFPEGREETRIKPANSHYDFPADPFLDSCPWTCNAGYTNYLLDSRGNRLHQLCTGSERQRCECVACSNWLPCSSGRMKLPCTPAFDNTCGDCFGYANGVLKDKTFCGRGYYLHDFCPLLPWETGRQNSSAFKSQCIKCHNYKPLHAFYTFPSGDLASECAWECFPGYQRVQHPTGDTCVPCTSLDCHPLVTVVSTLASMQTGLPTAGELAALIERSNMEASTVTSGASPVTSRLPALLLSGNVSWLAIPIMSQASEPFRTNEQREYNSTVYLKEYQAPQTLHVSLELVVRDLATVVVNDVTVGLVSPSRRNFSETFGVPDGRVVDKRSFHRGSVNLHGKKEKKALLFSSSLSHRRLCLAAQTFRLFV